MELTFLGTSSMVPTKKRSHNAMFLVHKEDGILIDCGEGTQRQIKLAGIKPTKVTIILITHWHGDHVLGLPGLIQTIGASEYTKTMRIFGPRGSKTHFAHMKKAFIFEEKMELHVEEVGNGVFYETDDLVFESRELEHGVACVGFSIREKDRRRLSKDALAKHGIRAVENLKALQRGEDIRLGGTRIAAKDATYVVAGKKVTTIMDTRFCKSAVALAQESDLLICEATFTERYRDKARAYRHMTAKDAARIAVQANAKRLVLTHFSQRYKDAREVEAEAREVFENVSCANDFMKVRI